jgi:hypothetical protein
MAGPGGPLYNPSIYSEKLDSSFASDAATRRRIRIRDMLPYGTSYSTLSPDQAEMAAQLGKADRLGGGGGGRLRGLGTAMTRSMLAESGMPLAGPLASLAGDIGPMTIGLELITDIKTGKKTKKPVTHGGNYDGRPALLDANGVAIPLDDNGVLTADPVFLQFQTKRTAAFSDLGLVPPPGW